jgi:flagellar biosynthesis/type III secretory pathway chaperone
MLTPDMCPVTNEDKIKAAKLPYQALLGCLIYVAKTRPDVCYAISDAARFMSCWGVEHFKAALRILRFLYATRDKCIHITPDNNDFFLYAFVDANWCDPRATDDKIDDKYKAQYGYVVAVSGCLLSWTSRRQQSRALSSMEAEYYAASEVMKEIIWWRALFCELGFEQTSPTIVYEDNKACISFSKNNTCHARTKHIDLRAHDCRDKVKNGEIKLVHIETNNQLADMMTKSQLKHTFIDHCDRLFDGTHIPKTVCKHISQVNCNCISCFVGGVVCQKSVVFDPVRMIDPFW